MRYQQNLQIALRERFRRLLNQGTSTYSHELGLILDWIEEQRILKLLLENALANNPNTDVDSWREQCTMNRSLVWPKGLTEEGRAVLIWQFMKLMKEDPDLPWHTGTLLTNENNLDAMVRALTSSIVRPFFDYLEEQLGMESDVLYAIERYKMRLEWFDRERMHAEYLSNKQKGELAYDIDFRKTLFDQGFNMPLAQVRSASGLSDAVGDLETSDPLICEVKLFDAGSHGKTSLATGVNQAVQYSKDFHKRVSYLIVINLSGRVLEFPSDGETQKWPPYLDLSGVRVHLVDIRALPGSPASKQGKLDSIPITREELTLTA